MSDNIYKMINYEYIEEYAKSNLLIENGDIDERLIKLINNHKKKIQNILEGYIDKEFFNNFLHKILIAAYQNAHFRPHDILKEDFFLKLTCDALFISLDYYDEVIENNDKDIKSFNFINRIFYFCSVISMAVKDALKIDLKSFKSTWDNDFLHYQYSNEFNQLVTQVINNDNIKDINFNDFKNKILTKLKSVCYRTFTQVDFSEKEKKALKGLLKIAYNLHYDFSESRHKFINHSSLTGFDQHVINMINHFLQEKGIEYSNLTNNFLIISQIQDEYVNENFYYQFITDKDYYNKNLSDVTTNIGIALIFYIYDVIIDELAFLYRTDRQGYFKISFKISERLTKFEDNFDFSYFYNLQIYKKGKENQKNLLKQILYKFAIPAVGIVFNTFFAKFIGFITQRSNSVTDEIRMNASIIMGIVSSLDSFIMSYLFNFLLKDEDSFYLYSADGSVIAFGIGSLTPIPQRTTITRTISMNSINENGLSDPSLFQNTRADTIPGRFPDPVPIPGHVHDGFKRRKRSTEINDHVVDNEHIYIRYHDFIKKKSDKENYESNPLLKKWIEQNQYRVMKHKPLTQKYDYDYKKVVDSLNFIQDELLNFRNIDLANEYLKDRSYSVQDDLTININRNDFNEKYFFLQVFNINVDYFDKNDMDRIDERIFIISKIMCDEEFYSQSKNLNLNFGFYDFMQYSNMFVDQKNLHISRRILLTILLIYLYKQGDDILKTIKNIEEKILENELAQLKPKAPVSEINRKFNAIISIHKKTIQNIISVIKYFTEITCCNNTRIILRSLMKLQNDIYSITNKTSNETVIKIPMDVIPMHVKHDLYARNVKGLYYKQNPEGKYSLGVHHSTGLEVAKLKAIPANLHDTILAGMLTEKNLANDFFLFSRDHHGNIIGSLSDSPSDANFIGIAKMMLIYEDLLLSHNNTAVMDKFDIDSFMENLQKTVKFKVNIIFNNADSILFILKKIKMIIEGEH
ncbi:hypothetical protein CJJ19_06435 [Candidatus Williamhamiltonella defendens]|nr:hypothetical protein [Candidatus Hamiltonella defensa]AYB49184.1 hypothetical protein CJJ19_06435 [Candidatus Hamiltonella defensa]